MNDQAIFLATTKAFESLDHLRATRRGVETLTMIETCAETRARLKASLATLDREARDLAAYIDRLRGTRKDPDESPTAS